LVVRFKIIDRKNPLDLSAPPKYYASVKSSGHIDLQELALQIGEMSCINTLDTVAVIDALLKVIPRELAKGKIVDLGEFGSYHLSLSSKGEADTKDVTSDSIVKARAHFRPGPQFREALQSLKYKREVPAV
jgi:predicted histone-like DNA-binding protein